MEKLVTCIAQVWFLAHSSTESSNLEGSVGLLYELWSLILSMDFLWIQVRWIGWAILAALLSFSETNWEFPWLCVWIIVLQKCPPCFHLHHPGRWSHDVTSGPHQATAVWVHYYCFFDTIVHANSRSFWSSPQVILGPWTSLLIIIFIPLSEILRGAPGCGRFMVKRCSFHFRIMAPAMLTGNIQKYRNPSVTNAISMFCSNKVAKVLRELFAFTHHEMFSCVTRW